jgi:hypothetical protein
MENLNSLDGFCQKVSLSLKLVYRALHRSYCTYLNDSMDFVQAPRLHKILDNPIHDH